jgi:5'-AMP-activated protein kinase catalytic alpha subunit
LRKIDLLIRLALKPGRREPLSCIWANLSFSEIEAFHEQTGHKVAIKILNKKKIKQYGVFEKVKRELKILRRFNNPHTIKLFEFIDTQSEIFMVLEYAAGGELFDLIARKERVSKIFH